MDGILNIDKPQGITSADVVRRLKKASRGGKVGHGGTLDPLATGVLPICFGQGTRVAQYLLDCRKEYEAIIRLGIETDTYDSTGNVVKKQDVPYISQFDLSRIVNSFKGSFGQIPPMYCALKSKGKRLYELARMGIDVPRAPKQVVVHEINVISWNPPLLTIKVTCGSGFYVRSLAHDVGQGLGLGAHLTDLIRLRSGPFHIGQSLKLNEAEEKINDGNWDQLEPLDVVLSGMNVLVLDRDEEDDIVHGRKISTPGYITPEGENSRCRAYSKDGKFLAIVTSEGGSSTWRPKKVFQNGLQCLSQLKVK